MVSGFKNGEIKNTEMLISRINVHDRNNESAGKRSIVEHQTIE